jgi:hypothetical protein
MLGAVYSDVRFRDADVPSGRSLCEMWIPADAAEVENAAKRGDLVETLAFDAKAALPTGKKNFTLAVDVAAMTTEGGLLLYGVGEDADGVPNRPEPIELAGMGQRVDQIVSASLREIPFIDVRELPLAGDSSRGYLALVIPASDRAPHQVVVGEEFRFYGRGPKGNRILTEGEIARLYRRREEWSQDGLALLRSVMAGAGVLDAPDHGILHAFARPVSSDPDLIERALPGLGEEQGIHQRLLQEVAATRLTDSYGPNLMRAAYWEHPSADEWRLATLPAEEKLNRLSDLSELGLNRDGRGRLLCGRASDSRMRDGGAEVIIEAVIAGNLEAFFKVVGAVYEEAGYLGLVDVGVAIVGISGAGSLVRSEDWGGGSFSYGAESFTRVARISAAEMSHASSIAHRLLRHFYEATTGVVGYNPFSVSGT